MYIVAYCCEKMVESFFVIRLYFHVWR